MLNAIMCTFLQKTRTEPGENILTNRQTEKASKQDKQTDNHFNQQRNQSETGGAGGGRRDVNHFEKGREYSSIGVSCISCQGR